MTKKDFILFAEMFKRIKPISYIDCTTNIVTIDLVYKQSNKYIMWSTLVDNFCSVCYTINNRFNSEKFKNACGYYG